MARRSDFIDKDDFESCECDQDQEEGDQDQEESDQDQEESDQDREEGSRTQTQPEKKVRAAAIEKSVNSMSPVVFSYSWCMLLI